MSKRPRLSNAAIQPVLVGREVIAALPVYRANLEGKKKTLSLPSLSCSLSVDYNSQDLDL